MEVLHVLGRGLDKVPTMIRSIMSWLLAAIITAAVAETAAFVGLRILGMPTTYAKPNRTENNPWGAWGKPNSVSRHAFECYDVPYRFNSVGARDVERSLQGEGRWIAIGDSFMEGYGLPEEDRVSNLIESATGHQILNFSTSGNFGPLQYLILYQQLASKFEHKGLMVGFLPDNDFQDNDPIWYEKNRSKGHWLRHRPYYELAPDGNSFKIRYGVHGETIPSDDLDKEPMRPTESAIQNAIGNVKRTTSLNVKDAARHSSFFTLLHSVGAKVLAPKTSDEQDAQAGYFMTDAKAARAAELIFASLADSAMDKQKVMLIFPRDIDLNNQRKTGKKGSPEFLAFLEHVSKQGWQIIDLSDLETIQNMPDVTLGCNGHWNAAANHAAAAAIEGRVKW